jgi:hypothetical protein
MGALVQIYSVAIKKGWKMNLNTDTLSKIALGQLPG